MSSEGENAREPEVRHVLLNTQLLFFTVLVVCLFINHGTTAQNDGISFYGVYHLTIPIIVPGFCVGSYGMWRTATYFAGTDAPALTVVGLRIVAIGLIVLLITPFNRGTFLNWTHMTTGIIMALAELVIGVLLLVQHRAARSVAAFALALAGGLLAAASLPDWHFEYLLQGEIIFEIGFSWCLIEWTYALFAREHRSFVSRR